MTHAASGVFVSPIFACIFVNTREKEIVVAENTLKEGTYNTQA